MSVAAGGEVPVQLEQHPLGLAGPSPNRMRVVEARPGPQLAGAARDRDGDHVRDERDAAPASSDARCVNRDHISTGPGPSRHRTPCRYSTARRNVGSSGICPMRGVALPAVGRVVRAADDGIVSNCPVRPFSSRMPVEPSDVNTTRVVDRRGDADLRRASSGREHVGLQLDRLAVLRRARRTAS